MQATPRIALFIDAENIPAPKAEVVVRLLDEVGNLTSRLAYGPLGPRPGWTVAFLRENALDYVPVIAPAKNKKDAVDKRLIADAVARLERGTVDVLAVAAGDSDYWPLVRHARGMVSEVWGFALPGNSGASYRDECTRFFLLDGVDAATGEARVKRELAKAAGALRILRKKEDRPKPEVALPNGVRKAPDGGWSTRAPAGVDLNGVRHVLIDALRDGRLLDFNSPEFYRLIPDRRVLFDALTAISEESNARHGVLLSAVAYNASRKIPGKGFFAMAKRCGKPFVAGDEEDMARMWAEELAKARDWARKQGGG